MINLLKCAATRRTKTPKVRNGVRRFLWLFPVPAPLPTRHDVNYLLFWDLIVGALEKRIWHHL